jgi:hypothetical protein
VPALPVGVWIRGWVRGRVETQNMQAGTALRVQGSGFRVQG